MIYNNHTNFTAIAQGIYEMTESLGEEYISALAFGMLPAPLMSIAEKQYKEKVASTYADKYGLPLEICVRAVKPEAVSEFMHELSTAILKVAKEKNLLVV